MAYCILTPQPDGAGCCDKCDPDHNKPLKLHVKRWCGPQPVWFMNPAMRPTGDKPAPRDLVLVLLRRYAALPDPPVSRDVFLDRIDACLTCDRLTDAGCRDFERGSGCKRTRHWFTRLVLGSGCKLAANERTEPGQTSAAATEHDEGAEDQEDSDDHAASGAEETID